MIQSVAFFMDENRNIAKYFGDIETSREYRGDFCSVWREALIKSNGDAASAMPESVLP